MLSLWIGSTKPCLSFLGKFEICLGDHVIACCRDLLFLLVVIQIAYMWAPSELTSKYAYSSQLPTTDFDDFDDEIGLEMSDSYVPGQNNEFVIGEDEDEEEDDDEFDKDFASEDDSPVYDKIKPSKKVALD